MQISALLIVERSATIQRVKTLIRLLMVLPPSLLLLVLPVVSAQSPDPEFQIQSITKEDPFGVNITWSSEAGTGYQVQRGSELEDWQPIAIQEGSFGSPSTGYIDSELPDTTSWFYRIAELGDLSVTINDGTIVDRGGSMTLTTDLLSVTDSVFPPESIVYSLHEGGYSGLLTGYFVFTDAPGEAISSFTQADLEAGRVVYQDGIGDILMPEIRVDSFVFSASDGSGYSGSRSFLIQRNLPEFGPEDGTIIWAAGDGDAFYDGGPGDDAFVLRGSDDFENILVQPSADGTQIVMTVNDTETVILDGFEDLYFMMGNGDNSVELSGDFSDTDLSPDTVFLYGGDGDDRFVNALTGVPGAQRIYADFVAFPGGGNNCVFFTNHRAAFVSGALGAVRIRGEQDVDEDIVTFRGDALFQQQAYLAGGSNVVQFGEAFVHITEQTRSQNGISESSRIHVDFSTLRQAHRLLNANDDPLRVILDRRGDGYSFDTTVAFNYLVDEPNPGNPQVEVAEAFEKFLRDPRVDVAQVNTLTPAQVEVGDAFTAIINGNSVSYSATNPTVSDVTAGLAQVWNISPFATSEKISAVDKRDRIELIAEETGSSFVVHVSTINGGAINDQTLVQKTVLEGIDTAPPEYFLIGDFNADPNRSNALIGIELSGIPPPIPPSQEILVGADFEDVIFAGDNLSVADEDLPPLLDPTLGDRLFGKGGDDFMVGDRFDNLFNGGSGDDRMEGRRGDDLFVWSTGNDHIDGGEGFDTVSYETDPFFLEDPTNRAGEVSVTQNGIGRYQVTYDRIRISDGAVSGPSIDTLVDVERIIGSIRKDVMNGGDEDNHFVGGPGDDVLNGGAGSDTLEGGTGDDYIEGGPGDDIITDAVSDGDGTQRIFGGPGNDIITSGASGRINGDGGDDEITGSSYADTIDGGAGRDIVSARSGDDVGIFRLGEVGSGNDVYDGGFGTDTLRIFIHDPLNISQAEIDELKAVKAYFDGGASGRQAFDLIKLELTGWEKLEINLDLDSLDPLPPTDITLSNNEIAENAFGAFIGNLTVDDPNNGIGDSHTFDFSDPNFEVRNENQLHLVPGVSLDFETVEMVVLTIGATDLLGQRFAKDFTIQVLDEPTTILLSNSSFREESPGQAVGFIALTDFDPNPTITFSDPRFEVVNGILKLTGATSVDFETEPVMPIDLTITAEDGDGNQLPVMFPLTVIDIDEAPSGFPSSPGDLDGANGFAFTDQLSGSKAGLSLSPAGDTNGDGFEDLLVASYGFDSGSLVDFAYLIPGGANLPARITAVDLAAQGGTTFTLPSGGLSGIPSAAPLGDFNGDGLEDIILGANGASGANNAFLAGQVFVVLGQAGGWPADIDLTDNATIDGVSIFKVEGVSESERLGTSVGAAGDIDGDGFDDALIGFGMGGSLILYGQAGPYTASQTSDNISGMQSTWMNPDYVGPVVGIHDFNGDGYDDLFAGIDPDDALVSTSGSILFGRAGGLATEVDPTQTADVLITGGANRAIGMELGQVGPAGDLNGDGFEDIFLVARVFDQPVTIEGDLIVLYGSETVPAAIALGDNDGTGPNEASPITFLASGTSGVQILPGASYGRSGSADLRTRE